MSREKESATPRLPGLQIASELNTDTKLYRYVSLSQFMAFVESGLLRLGRVLDWEDTWELPISKLPRATDKGTYEYAKWNVGEVTYAQCWTTLAESDAMWRIYSPNREAVLVQSSVAKFVNLLDLHFALLAPVHYFDELSEISERFWKDHKWPLFLSEALLKRRAFEHEREIRLVTIDGEWITRREHVTPSGLLLPVDPIQFVEGVTLDPRSPDWFVEMIGRYCRRAGLNLPVTRSTIYDRDIHGATGMSIQYVPVQRE